MPEIDKIPETERQLKVDLENLQKDTDKARSEFIANLPEQDRMKYETVERVTKELHDAGISAYLFALLPIYNEGGTEGMLQYNTLSQHLQFDDTGRIKEETARKFGLINDSLLYSVFSLPIFKKFSNPLDNLVYLSNLFQQAITRDLRRYEKARKERAPKEEDSVVPLQ